MFLFWAASELCAEGLLRLGWLRAFFLPMAWCSHWMNYGRIDDKKTLR
jgi:hypothetical protein